METRQGKKNQSCDQPTENQIEEKDYKIENPQKEVKDADEVPKMVLAQNQGTPEW